MNFNIWLGALLHQKSYAARLIAGKVLIDDAPTGENQRELFIGNFLRPAVFNRVKPGLAVGMIEAIFKQARRAGMIQGWTRPEDAVVRLNFFPGDAVVVGIPAARSDPQLFEHV